MIAVLRRLAVGIEESNTVDPQSIRSATDFIRWYADRCHHGKEEDILFRELATKPMDPPLGDLMAELIRDHVFGRQLTGDLVSANDAYASGDTARLADITATLRALVDFYPAHIEKEERLFFKPCMRYLSQEERTEMLRDFDEFDRTLIHSRYEERVEELEMLFL